MKIEKQRISYALAKKNKELFYYRLLQIEFQWAALGGFEQPSFDLKTESLKTRPLVDKLMWAFKHIWIL